MIIVTQYYLVHNNTAIETNNSHRNILCAEITVTFQVKHFEILDNNFVYVSRLMFYYSLQATSENISF